MPDLSYRSLFYKVIVLDAQNCCIVVETEQEIPTFIQKLEELETLCEEPLTQEQKSLLFSKVISFELIKKDF